MAIRQNRRVDRAHLEDVEQWRAGRLARLTAPDGWLSLAGLAWLREGENRVGGDPSADVVIPGEGVAATVGTIVVRNGQALARLAPGAGVTVKGELVSDSLPLRDDSLGEPTRIRVGRATLHVIRRDGRLAARISDPESPARRRFRGIEHYPVDARWRLDARFEAYEPERTVAVPTVLGYDETYRMPGVLSFDLAGATHRLDAFLQPGEDDLFLVFADTTNGRETYGAGRYPYAPPPDERGIVVVDFNRAYNPPCVFTPHATCPLPLPQNRLPIRVEAGEKRYD